MALPIKNTYRKRAFISQMIHYYAVPQRAKQLRFTQTHCTCKQVFVIHKIILKHLVNGIVLYYILTKCNKKCSSTHLKTGQNTNGDTHQLMQLYRRTRLYNLLELLWWTQTTSLSKTHQFTKYDSPYPLGMRFNNSKTCVLVSKLYFKDI